MLVEDMSINVIVTKREKKKDLHFRKTEKLCILQYKYQAMFFHDSKSLFPT